MDQIATIHKSIDYIESRLRKPLTVGRIADAAGYSLFHFSRTFNRIVQHTPYDYLMHRRLAESAKDLLATDQRIIDIAYDYQFANPETYTRAFRRVFGLVPSQMRTQAHLPYRRGLPRLTLEHLVYRAGGPLPHVEITTFPETCIVGLMTLTATDHPGTMDELWSVLDSRLTERELTGDTTYTVIQDAVTGTGHSRIAMAGVVGPSADPEWGWVQMIVPTATVARCALTPKPDDLPLTLDYLYHTWMTKAKTQPTRPLEIIIHERALDTPLPGTPRCVMIPVNLPQRTKPARQKS